MEGIEICDAIDAEHDRLAINDEPPVPVFTCGLHDPRISVGPVIATARDQSHAVAIALQPEPVAVVLDLVEPVRTGGDGGGFARKAEVEGHGVAER